MRPATAVPSIGKPRIFPARRRAADSAWQALVVAAACMLPGCYQYALVDNNDIQGGTAMESARITLRGGERIALTSVSFGPDSVVGYDGQQLRVAFARGDASLVEQHRLHTQNTVLAVLGTAGVLGLATVLVLGFYANANGN